jgi:hypothetical protein
LVSDHTPIFRIGPALRMMVVELTVVCHDQYRIVF